MSIQILVPDIGDFENVEVIEILVKRGDKVKKNDSLIAIELYRKWKNKSSVEVPSTEEGTVENLNVKIGDKVTKGDLILTLLGKMIEDRKDNIPPVTEKIIQEAESAIIKEKVIKSEYSHSDFGEVEIKDMPRNKRLAAPHLINSWSAIPHATHHDEIDITEMEEFGNSLVDNNTGEKLKITPLVFIIKALVGALKKFPLFNSSIDESKSGKITYKKYYHIGIAVDTFHGLMVPKIRDVNNKTLKYLGDELREVSEKCRNLKIDKKEFYGGSMTILSLGEIGGSFFTPIINYPEVAILGVSKSTKKQLYFQKNFQIRTILPISLSYDLRIINGVEAARFCNELRENLGKNFAYKLAI
jgi:pyruvate dehydrogenase E2 component (dihydrolipoamide acetyltransferase)